MNINGTFRFHNIGQGLFYSGIINKKDAKKHDVFSFVYDCGTVSSKYFLMREIHTFKLLLPETGPHHEKKLDLLIISHLHDDHVNGLEYLLKDIKVDTVIMPYVDESLKTLPLVESAGNNEFLRTFYLDPIEWFASRGVRRILLLGAEDEAPEKELFPDRFPDNNDSGIQVDPESVGRTTRRNGTSIIYLKNESSIRCNNYCWEFKFENLKLDPDKIDSYKHIVEWYMKEYKTLEEILKDKRLIKKLREEIRIECGNILNRTSVVLLHGPMASDALVRFGFRNSCLCSYWVPLKIDDDIQGSTVLTGNVQLNAGESFQILDNASVKHRYLVVQFPHHGSKNNNIKYFCDLWAIITILSYGIANPYGHPHGKVLQQLERLAHVTERQAYDYQISIF